MSGEYQPTEKRKKPCDGGSEKDKISVATVNKADFSEEDTLDVGLA